MSYTPTEWKTGDVITADKLNNMEDGIVNAGQNVMVAKFTESENVWSCDKTNEQMIECLDNGGCVIGFFSNMGFLTCVPLYSYRTGQYATINFQIINISGTAQQGQAVITQTIFSVRQDNTVQQIVQTYTVQYV